MVCLYSLYVTKVDVKHLSCRYMCFYYLLSVISYQFIITYYGHLFIQRCSKSDLKKALLTFGTIIQISCQPDQTFFFMYYWSVHYYWFRFKLLNFSTRRYYLFFFVIFICLKGRVLIVVSKLSLTKLWVWLSWAKYHILLTLQYVCPQHGR